MTVRFSTLNVPEPSRKDAVEAAFGVHVRGTIDFPPESPVSVNLDLRALGSVHLAHMASSPLRLVTPACTSDMVYVGMTRSGGGVLDASGANRTVRSGDVNVLSRGRTSITVVAEPSTVLSIAIPRPQLLPRLASGDALQSSARPSLPAARLLESYAMAMLETKGMTTPDEEAVFERHLVDLVVLMLGGRRDEAELAHRNGARAARRHAIRADIAANLGLPELSVTWMARRHGVSPSYVRALFYDEGTSFTDHVLNSRLDRVHGMLTEPCLRDRTIAALALMGGFGDISWFNQAFRRRYGMTPSELRQHPGGGHRLAAVVSHPVA